MHITTLGFVRMGLKNGHSYKRKLTEGIGWEYLRPVFPLSTGRIEHTIVGENNGGWGGVAELDIQILNNGRFQYYGWVQMDY